MVKRRAVKLCRRAMTTNNERWWIYLLSDPATDEPRYIGITHRPAESRYQAHLYAAKRGGHTHKACWIRSLLKRGLRPKIAVLSGGNGEGWQEAERHWIAFFRALGARLTNLTDGGEGTLGHRRSLKSRAKSRSALQKYYEAPEARAKIGAAVRRHYDAPGARAKLAAALMGNKNALGCRRSPKTRAKISAAKIGHEVSPETRAKISIANRKTAARKRKRLLKSATVRETRDDR